MKHSFAKIIAAAALALPWLLSFTLPAHATTLAPGDLVKLADDGNLETTADSAVYYRGADGKRYVFPNSQTYFTWYADFSTVKVVTASEMAAMQIGGNVTYRSGTRLVKITSDPNVYAVEPGGKLRWVQTEEVAKALYGNEWNKRIDDIPDAYFFNYSIAEPLAAAVYPNGTVVKRTTDNAIFLIQDRTKRKLATTAVKDALRIRDAFVLTTSSALSDYPDAAEVATAESTLTDTSQKTTVALPSLPTIVVKQPATTYISVGGDATLIELRLSSVKAFVLKRLTAKIEATTNNPADKEIIDDDKGGLVYQNNAQPNLKTIRFIDETGAEPMGRKDIVLDVAQDQAQTFVFTGSISVPAGVERTLFLRTQLNGLLPTGEGYKVTLPVSGIEIVDAATGAATAFDPKTDLVGPSLSSLNASLEVSSSSSPGNKTYVRGAKNVELAGLTFKATTVAPNVIKSLTLQGYVDEEGTAGFLAGSDSDNGTATTVKDMVPLVNLHASDGTKIAGPVAVDNNGKATFSGLSYSIPAGQSAVLVVRGDILANVELEQQPNKLTFDVTSAPDDVQVVDDKGAKVNATGALPNGGPNASYSSTIRKNGQITFLWSGSGGPVVVGKEIQLGTLSADVKYDNYTLKTVSFRATGAHTSLTDLRLEYPSGTSTASVSTTMFGDVATFNNIAVSLPTDPKGEATKKTDLKLYGKVKAKDAGAVYGETIAVKFGAADTLQFSSLSTLEVFNESNLTGDYTVTTNTDSSVKVRFSTLTAEKATSQPATVYGADATDVLKFSLKAGTEGAVRVKKLTFKLTPNDAGYPDLTKPENAGKTAADNDSLELWADINGDFNDDDGIVDFRQVLSSGSTSSPIGEDGSANIRYSMYHDGAKDTTPQGTDSKGGDYGLLEYVFSEGSEIGISAGATMSFSFGVNTIGFRAGVTHTLAVELLAATDFEWTDIPSGAYTALSGSDATGISLSNTVSVSR